MELTASKKKRLYIGETIHSTVDKNGSKNHTSKNSRKN